MAANGSPRMLPEQSTTKQKILPVASRPKKLAEAKDWAFSNVSINWPSRTSPASPVPDAGSDDSDSASPAVDGMFPAMSAAVGSDFSNAFSNAVVSFVGSMVSVDINSCSAVLVVFSSFNGAAFNGANVPVSPSFSLGSGSGIVKSISTTKSARWAAVLIIHGGVFLSFDQVLVDVSGLV